MNLQRTPVAAAPPAAPARKHRVSGPGHALGEAVPNAGQTALSDGEFTRLADRVRALTGIVLPLHKRQLVISRLRKRLRALGIDGFGAYLAYLDSPAGEAETGEMINVITTNLTAFFREGHHFDDMARVLAPRPGEAGTTRRRRIWSAACSTGEEPYSIAITALQAGLAGPGANLRILATDLDTAALSRAQAAAYPAERIDACPPEYRRGYFDTLPDGRIRVSGRARGLVTFNQLNLHEPWPVKGPFDAIFCRNVLIYFDAEAKQAIVERFIGLLHPGGTLYLGHSESMLGNHPQLVNQGRTIFRKCA
ncbi:MAG: protein-glutamate O-methyltransferase CheR [Limibaculum sp.]